MEGNPKASADPVLEQIARQGRISTQVLIKKLVSQGIMMVPLHVPGMKQDFRSVKPFPEQNHTLFPNMGRSLGRDTQTPYTELALSPS